MSPKTSQIHNIYDNPGEKMNSPLMRVGSTITTQISSPSSEIQTMMSASTYRNDLVKN